MGKHAKLKEKQKWSNEKLHLENARKLRGICFIDSEDKEFKETMKNARKNLERQATRVSMERPVVRQMISNQSLRESWKLVNLPECVWKNLCQIFMRTMLQERETIHYSITI